jgi:hypothetical protein
VISDNGHQLTHANDEDVDLSIKHKISITHDTAARPAAKSTFKFRRLDFRGQRSEYISQFDRYFLFYDQNLKLMNLIVYILLYYLNFSKKY